MNRRFIGIVIGFLLMYALPVHGKSEHDNYVYFTTVSLTHFDFQMHDHYITSGQPWGGISVGYSSSAGIIDVSAGRHASEDAANWFNDRADVAIDTRHTGGIGFPQELNFAIYGDLEVGGYEGSSALCKGIVIGQGHVGAYNNWWIGGKNANMYELNGQYWLECPPVDGHCGGLVLISTHESDTFPLELRMCPASQSKEPPYYPKHR